MIKPFDHIELVQESVFNTKTINLNIERNPSPKIILLRGLIGSIKIKHNLTDIEFDQDIDYFDIEKRNPETNPLVKLANYISQEYSVDEIGDIFEDKIFLHQNFNFFERLTNEFSNYYYYEKKESYTTAFVFLYRILETISYAFPLIYASKTDDFIGTYNFLKECISGNKEKGELGFFKSFVKTAFKDDPLYESTVDIKILCDDEDKQISLFNSFRKACPNEEVFGENTDEPRLISVKFSEYSSFIINLRNRFFHLFSSGQPNLQSYEVLDSDYFFKMVNKKTANWLSILLLEVLKHSIIKYERKPLQY